MLFFAANCKSFAPIRKRGVDHVRYPNINYTCKTEASNVLSQYLQSLGAACAQQKHEQRFSTNIIYHNTAHSIVIIISRTYSVIDVLGY